MGDLKRRIELVEARRKTGKARLSREALRHLSDEDLDALEDALEAGQEDGTATFEELYRAAGERSRRVLDALRECIEVLIEGREPPSSPASGEEGTRQSRNGYRIGSTGSDDRKESSMVDEARRKELKVREGENP